MADNDEVICITNKEGEDLKTCEYCNFKAKGEMLLQRHQKAIHFKCHSCEMVAVSMKHLKVHKKSAQPENNCNPCGVSFQDEIRCDVHILKEHPFICEECGDKYTKQSNLDIHIKTKHFKEIKCIVCEFKGSDEHEITKHYEAVHLNTNDSEIEEIQKDIPACKNGPTCKYLKENRCNFAHDQSAEQPWEQAKARRSRHTKETREPREQYRGTRNVDREPAQLAREPRPACS